MGGILKVESDRLSVDFSRLFWYQVADHDYKQKYLNYFADQGYAEAERLPYEQRQDGLYVTWQPNAEKAGWHRAESVDGIPF